jgi:lipopolysaccharide exporter
MSHSGKYGGWLHAGFFSGLQKLSVPLSGLFITMILAHKALTKEEMGVWAIFMSITTIIEMIRQGLVKTAMVRFINHSDSTDHRFVIGGGLFFNIIITLFISVVMFLLTPYFASLLKAPQLVSMLYILQIGLIIMIPFSHFEWLMYSKTLFKGLFWTYFLRQGLTLLLVFFIFLFYKKISLNELVIIYNVALLAGTIVAYKYVQRFLVKSFVFSKYWVLKLFHYGKYVFGTGLSTMVFRSADQVMLSPLLGTTVFNASQNIAMRFINLSDLPSQTLGDILFPKSSQSENSNNPAKLKYYYEKTVGASLCVVVPLVIFVLLFPKAIIFVLAGSQYYDAIPYLRLIAMSGITLSFLKQYATIMDSTGKPYINLITTTIIAVLHVGFLYFFIKHFQFIGAGYALLLSHTVGFCMTQFLLYKLFKINFLNAFKYAFLFYPEFFKIVKEKLPWKFR